MGIIRLASGVGLALLLATGAAQAQSAQAVPQLDLGKYVGAWYQVAQYPNKRDKHCLSDEIVLLTIGEKRDHFDVVTSCRTRDGSAEVRNASGKRADKVGDGKLKLSYLFPFSVKDWVLAVAPDYSWALVGMPNRKSLSVLSRTPTLDSGILDGIKARATANGYDPGKLVTISQSGSQLGRPLHAAQ